MAESLSCSQKTKMKMGNALKRLMKNTTFEKITVSDITNECNIHRQTFYYHFQDRYELLDWLLYNELILPLVTDFNLDNMCDKLYGMFEQIANDKKFYQNALKLSSDDLTRYINRIANEQITKLVKSLAVQNGLTAATEKDDIVSAEFIGYGICGVVISWIQKGMKESPKEMTERLHSLIVSCKQLAIKRN